MNLYQRVKSISEISYEVIDKFGEIVKGEKKRESAFDYDKLILLNPEGNVVEKSLFESNGNLKEKILYKYDSKGYLIEQQMLKSDGNLNIKISYENNEKGNPTSEDWYNVDGSLKSKNVYKYDEAGNKIESNWYNADGSLFIKNVSVYDGKGNEISTDDYNSTGILTSKSIFQHDENGNETERKYNVFETKMMLNFNSSYDNKNNKIQETRSENNVVYYNYTFKYIYDVNNNWISKIAFQNGVLPKFIIERKIEYYEK